MTLKKLETAAEKYGCDKLKHGYLPFYAGLLTKGTKRVLEIGIYEGAGLCMWSSVLPKGKDGGLYVAVDIEPNHYETGHLHDEVVALKKSQDNFEMVWEDIKAYTPKGTFDLIIDDGSHRNTDQIAAFERLWPLVAPGGWYVIEDLHTSLPYTYAKQAPNQWNDVRQPTIMEWLVQRWHDLNEWGAEEFGTAKPVFAQMRAARSIVAFQKPLD